MKPSLLESDKGPGELDSEAKEIRVFPTNLWVFPPPKNLESKAKQLINTALRLQEREPGNSSAALSGRGIWRSENPHPLKEFEEVYIQIQKNLATTCKRLGIPPGTHYFNSWIDIMEPGGYQVLHQHSPHLLGGTFYLSETIETGRLILKDPRPARLCSSKSQPGPSEIPVTATPCSTIIFPGWLEHSIEENKSTKKRITLSFDFSEKT